MKNAQNIPLTILSTTGSGTSSIITLGLINDPNYTVVPVPNKNQSQYWMVIFDRKTLKIAENFMFSDNVAVPSQIAKYVNDSNYFYILTTQLMISSRVPAGKFYDWLISEGAGKGLRTIEQCFFALNCASFITFSYTFINDFGPKVNSNLEFYNYQETRMITALELTPIQIAGSYLYTPTELH